MKEKEPLAKGMEGRLDGFAKRLARATALKSGTIRFRLTGSGAGEYSFECAPSSVRLVKEAPLGGHLIEIQGDATRILAILEGKKEARAQFLAGGIRVRGDIRYLSDLAFELGLMKEPL